MLYRQPDFSAYTFIASLLILLLLGNCKDSSTEIDKKDDEEIVIDDPIDDISESATKEDVLTAIDQFKSSMIALGTSGNGGGSRSTRFTQGSEDFFSRDLLVDANLGGHDEEWLNITFHVLTFAEKLTNSSYELGDESLYSDVLDDAEAWAWGSDENTVVIMSYVEEVLYLRVIDEALVQTFFFEYVNDGLIKILRLYESVTSEGNTLYVEDFQENFGINLWWSDYSSNPTFPGRYTSIVEAGNGWRLTIDGNKSSQQLRGGYYVLSGVPITIEGEMVRYDLSYVDVYDSFDAAGVLYLNDQVVDMPLEMSVWEYGNQYALTGTRIINTEIDPSEGETVDEPLGLEEANIISNITYQDYLDKFIPFDPVTTGISFNYGQSRDDVLADLSELLYLDY